MIDHLKKKHKIFVETIVKSKDPDRLKCKYCGKFFKHGHYLKDHINTHTGERPHICEHCGKTFASNANKNAHIKQAHLGKKRNYNNRQSNTKPNIL